MALVAVLFASRSAECRFAVVRRGDGWTLLWRSRAGASGGRKISSATAQALDRATGGRLHVSSAADGADSGLPSRPDRLISRAES
jgi:hypothetical protein